MMEVSRDEIEGILDTIEMTMKIHMSEPKVHTMVYSAKYKGHEFEHHVVTKRINELEFEEKQELFFMFRGIKYKEPYKIIRSILRIEDNKKENDDDN